jgi:hypothetical protein
MSKPKWSLALAALLAFGAALAVQGQENPPLTQPTVDAAVSTLLAQTQQAAANQQVATGTIQAALNAALTATAQAPASTTSVGGTPTTSVGGVPTLDAAGLRVAGQTEIDLLAGPGNSGAYLAPDGAHFAHLRSRTICIYEGDTQQGCVDLEGKIATLDSESIRWSPDSRYLVMTEDFFRTFNDPDIWVIDTADYSLRDLTDDGQGRVSIGSETVKGIDVVPGWLPDNRILFLRYNRLQGETMPPDVYVVAPDSGSPQKLGALQTRDNFAVYALDVQGDRLVYSYAAPKDTPDNGIWVSDLDGGNARQIAQTDRARLATWVDMSPDGRFVLAGAPGISMTYKPEDSLVYLVDVDSGSISLIDPERYLMGAGWAPTGSTLVYTAFDAIQPEQSGVFVSGAPGTPGMKLLDGRYNAATPQLRKPIAWGANNVVLLSRSPEPGIVLAQLAS